MPQTWLQTESQSKLSLKEQGLRFNLVIRVDVQEMSAALKAKKAPVF